MRKGCVVAVAVLLAACGGEDDAALDAGAAIAGFAEAPTAALGFSALNQVAHLDVEGTRAAALEAIEGGQGETLLPAAYAVSLTGIESDDAAALRPLLGHEDLRIRLLAAQTLAGAGVGEGMPVLIELLGSEEPLRDGLSVWEVARRTLLDLSGEDLGLDAADDVAQAAATIPTWQDWWAGAAEGFEPREREAVFG